MQLARVGNKRGLELCTYNSSACTTLLGVLDCRLQSEKAIIVVQRWQDCRMLPANDARYRTLVCKYELLECMLGYRTATPNALQLKIP